MSQHPEELTTLAHWDEVWRKPPRMRLPSSLVVATRNLQRILRAHVRPGSSFLELGCAPGKLLAWVALRLGARVSGLDYSPTGIAWARELFDALGCKGDLRCEELFSTSFPRDAFDIVFSSGLIEHFDDPSTIVA